MKNRQNLVQNINVSSIFFIMLFALSFLCFQVYALPPLSPASSYEVNGIQNTASGEFSNIDNLFTYINAWGVLSSGQTGTITIYIKSGYNSSTEPSAGITPLGAYPNMDSTRPILIRPFLGVSPVIQTNPPAASASANSSVIRFNGAKYVTIDGSNSGTQSRDLTIRVLPTNLISSVTVIGVCATVSSSCNEINIRNCIIIGANNSVLITHSGIYMGGGTSSPNSPALLSGNSDNVFQNNAIYFVRNGIYMRGSGTVPASVPTDSNNQVIQNTIGGNNANEYFGVNGSGIYLTNQTGSVISENEIHNCPGTSGNMKGIDITSVNGNCTNIEISKNLVHDLNYTGISSQGMIGIKVDVASGSSSNNINITNNMVWNISGDGGGAIGSITQIHGIHLSGATSNAGINVYFNSVKLQGNSLNASSFSSALTTGTGLTGGVRVLNNILINNLGFSAATGTGAAYAICAADASSNPFSVASNGIIENNDYWVNPTGNVNKFTGRIFNIDRITLTDWRAVTSQDVNSVNVDVVFSAADLHINFNLTPNYIESGAITIAGIGDDIDGDLRPGPVGSTNGGGAAPDIGADEFDGVLYNVSIGLVAGNDHNQFEIISIIPESSGEEISIIYDSNNNDPVLVNIYDILGKQLLKKENRNSEQGKNIIKIKTEHTEDGAIYFIVLQNKNKILTKKFVSPI